MRTRIAVFVTVFQMVMFAGHALLYETWSFFRGGTSPVLPWVVACLSVSFVAASVLAFRYHNVVVRWFYKAAAVWLGAASFFLFAALGCWLVFGVSRLLGLNVNGRTLADALFGAAAVVSAFGVINALATRVRRIKVKLPNLPASWRGRTAALISDLHLGHVWNSGFIRHIVRTISKLKPAIVWISGDLYDGTAVDAALVAAPLQGLNAPLGIYFVEGNHEEFRDPSKYLEAIRAAGVRVLENEKTDVDGLQVVGVPYRHATHAGHFQSVLQKICVVSDRASA